VQKLVSLVYSAVLIFYLFVPPFASSGDVVLCLSETDLGNGITAVDEVLAHQKSCSRIGEYTLRRTFTRGGAEIAKIAVRGVFRYDGDSVSVVSTEALQADAYDGWRYSQDVHASSGGTIVLGGKLDKPLVGSIPFTMTLSCDKDGNVSYT